MEKEKVKFSDLSDGLKAAIIVTWVMAGLTALSFIAGFIAGYLGG